MTTNMKRPSDLVTAWDGNLDSVIHTHRPGNSQKVSVKQIVDAAVAAVPAPTPPVVTPAVNWTGEKTAYIELDNSGTKQKMRVQQIIDAAVAAVPVAVAVGLASGDVVMKPVGTYGDFFLADGAIKLDTDAPALAAAIGNSNTHYNYSADSAIKFSFPESVAGTSFYGLSFCTMGDYGFYTAGTNYAQIVNLKTSTVVGTINYASQDLTAFTRNALYGLSTTFDVYMCSGIRTASPVFNATKIAAMTTEFRCIASIGDDIDLIVGSTQAYFKKINTSTRAVTAITPAGTVAITCATQGGTDKVFSLATINGKTGFFELIYDSAISNFRYKLIMDMAVTTGYISSSPGSSKVYFGRSGFEYCYDINTAKITPVVMPSNISLTVNSRVYSRDNVVCLVSSVYVADVNYLSFDSGTTWVLAPQLGYITMDMKLSSDGNDLIMMTKNPNYATQGSIQKNSLVKLAVDQFKLPNLMSSQEGYKYYVKK